MFPFQELCRELKYASKLDLEASKVLYDKKLFAPAVFHTQQAVEKALKAELIKIGIAPSEKEKLENFLIKTLGHRVAQAYPKIGNILIERIEKSLREQRISFVKRFAIRLALRELKKALSSIGKEYQQEMKRIEEIEIKKAILFVKTSLEKRINFDKELEKTFNTIKSQVPSHVNFPLETLIDECKKFSKSLERIIKLSLLSMLFEKFESISRYPSLTHPSSPRLLTEDHPLILELERFLKVLEELIECPKHNSCTVNC